MSTTATITVVNDGLTLSALIWKTFARKPEGMVEACLGLNQGLASYVILPVGTEVIMPVEMVTDSQSDARTIIRLWS